jgi:hypothetical protein
MVEAKTLADVKIKAAVEGERKKAEADLGSVRYLATLLGASVNSRDEALKAMGRA